MLGLLRKEEIVEGDKRKASKSKAVSFYKADEL
jgi:hypothetical protein